MNPHFLRYYSQELQHLREMGGEFARDFPKVAGRLGLDAFECADPYVERLLEGFSFLAARVQMKIDAEYPRFTQHLAGLVYPQLLAPTPSMAVVQLQADLANPGLVSGFAVPRGSSMYSTLGKGDTTACEFRSAHEVTLWPIELVLAKFFTQAGALPGLPAPLVSRVRAGLRLRLRCAGSKPFSALAIDHLDLFLRGGDDLPARLHECIFSGVLGLLVSPAGKTQAMATTAAEGSPVAAGKLAPPLTDQMQAGAGATSASWPRLLPASAVSPLGFDEDEALLPSDQRSFEGQRLLREYFAFPQRFLFLRLSGLAQALKSCNEQEVELCILLAQGDNRLEQSVDASHFALFCTPVINLFKRRADRIGITGEQFEYHVLVDRSRPMDHEVAGIEEVTGYGYRSGGVSGSGSGSGSGQDFQQTFRPLYHARDKVKAGEADQEQAFFQVRREPRVLSQRQRKNGPRSSYIGSETFIAIVDAAQAPYREDLRQLGLTVWCTNRDLPLSMPLGLGSTDFTLGTGAPLHAVRCVAGPSEPRAAVADGGLAWRLLSQLALNYQPLVDGNPRQSALALRELLALHCAPGDLAAQRQVEGVVSLAALPVTRRLPAPGVICFGRGWQMTVTLDDGAFEGSSAFLLGAVLARFFGQYASINSFTETVVRTQGRGQIMAWPPRGGLCATP